MEHVMFQFQYSPISTRLKFFKPCIIYAFQFQYSPISTYKDITTEEVRRLFQFQYSPISTLGIWMNTVQLFRFNSSIVRLVPTLELLTKFFKNVSILVQSDQYTFIKNWILKNKQFQFQYSPISTYKVRPSRAFFVQFQFQYSPISTDDEIELEGSFVSVSILVQSDQYYSTH